MNNTNKALTVCILVALMFTAGCRHNTNGAKPAVPVPAEVRIAQVVEVVSTINQNAAVALTGLVDAGQVTPENGKRIAGYLSTVTNTTEGIAKILQNKALPWPDKAIQIQNLCLSVVPPSQYKKLGVADSQQYQALVLTLDTLESTIKTVVQIVQSQPAAAPTQ